MSVIYSIVIDTHTLIQVSHPKFKSRLCLTKVTGFEPEFSEVSSIRHSFVTPIKQWVMAVHVTIIHPSKAKLQYVVRLMFLCPWIEWSLPVHAKSLLRVIVEKEKWKGLCTMKRQNSLMWDDCTAIKAVVMSGLCCHWGPCLGYGPTTAGVGRDPLMMFVFVLLPKVMQRASGLYWSQELCWGSTLR